MEPFAPGQVWTYKTRPGEEASRIIVCRVETDPKLGEIVHIHVNGLQISRDLCVEIDFLIRPELRRQFDSS